MIGTRVVHVRWTDLSGTTLIITTPEDAEAIHKAIPEALSNGDGTWSIPCQHVNSLEPLHLAVQGISLTITPQNYVLLPINHGSSMCMSGISGQPLDNANTWVLGDVFLKQFYTVSASDLPPSADIVI